MDLGLKDRVAAVAAASSGLGRATARALSDEGARVAICGRHRDTIVAAARSIAAETGREVEEFAAVVAFLCSERASYVTGTTLPIDGGAIRGLA